MPNVPTWHEALPRPTVYSYDTDAPTEVLMRCAERYDIEQYTD